MHGQGADFSEPQAHAFWTCAQSRNQSDLPLELHQSGTQLNVLRLRQFTPSGFCHRAVANHQLHVGSHCREVRLQFPVDLPSMLLASPRLLAISLQKGKPASRLIPFSAVVNPSPCSRRRNTERLVFLCPWTTNPRNSHSTNFTQDVQKTKKSAFLFWSLNTLHYFCAQFHRHKTTCHPWKQHFSIFNFQFLIFHF